MRFTQLILSIFLFITFAAALPVPATEDALVARASKQGDGKKNAKKVANGIDKNIAIQDKERKQAKQVGKAEGTKDFKKDKKKLLNTIDDGAKQRAKNQKNADKSNKQLTDGLKKVQKAQGTEKKQAQSLNGGKGDKKTLKTLDKEFAAGKKQNEKNKQAALKGNPKPKGKKGN
ncbi:hypothetical protein CSOJ01_12727 [Colletotrichum sojae]|uniref:Small secreted protein n=1 Tax=Colletotrichum sojae TaxID=2175907 RepID=A0A8H6IU55_9PEZI|nr:hypothetical protein CSOJ01_12727 [Colletotrichum sojae]